MTIEEALAEADAALQSGWSSIRSEILQTLIATITPQAARIAELEDKESRCADGSALLPPPPGAGGAADRANKIGYDIAWYRPWELSGPGLLTTANVRIAELEAQIGRMKEWDNMPATAIAEARIAEQDAYVKTLIVELDKLRHEGPRADAEAGTDDARHEAGIARWNLQSATERIAELERAVAEALDNESRECAAIAARAGDHQRKLHAAKHGLRIDEPWLIAYDVQSAIETRIALRSRAQPDITAKRPEGDQANG